MHVTEERLFVDILFMRQAHITYICATCDDVNNQCSV